MRAANASDLDDLVRIERLAFDSDRLSRRSLAAFVHRPTACVVVAEDCAVRGYAIVLFRRGAGAARLYSLAVAPEAAGHGIGRRLLSAAEEAATDRNCREMRLEVRADNRSAQGLYEANGYRITGRREAYYADGAGALRYSRPLLPYPSKAPGRIDRAA